jgi:hypothetical protein
MSRCGCWDLTSKCFVLSSTVHNPLASMMMPLGSMKSGV